MSAAQGLWWRPVSAMVAIASRSRWSQAHRKRARLDLPDSTATGAWPLSALSADLVGSGAMPDTAPMPTAGMGHMATASAAKRAPEITSTPASVGIAGAAAA